MKKRYVITYIVLMLALICTNVYATISANTELSISKSVFEKGDEFSVTLSITDLETTTGVKSVEGYINIDENILEDLTIESIVSEDGKVKINDDNILNVIDQVQSDGTASSESGVIFNDSPVSGKGDYRIVINFDKELTEDEELITINFKLKDDVENATYENAIEYTIFRIFSESEKVIIEDKAINLVVNTTEETPGDDTGDNSDDEEDKNQDQDQNQDTDNDSNNGTNDDSDDDNNNNNNDSDNENEGSSSNNDDDDSDKVTNQDNNSNGSADNNDDTVAQNPLPNTGYKLILIPIVVLVIAGVVFYKKYAKYNNIK